MIEKYIVVAIFSLYGLVATFKPKWIAAFQVWSNKNVLGAKFVPSKRTYRFYQAMGVLFLAMAGFVFIFG